MSVARCLECGHAKHGGECWAACGFCSGHATKDEVSLHFKTKDELGTRCGYCGYVWPCWRVARTMIEKARTGLKEILTLDFTESNHISNETLAVMVELEEGRKEP